MTADSVQVRAVRRNGTCVLEIAGELDTLTAGIFARRVDAAVRAVTGPVLVDLSGLTFLDAGGARALNAVMQTLPGGRTAILRTCPRPTRRILDLLGLPLDGQPAGPADTRRHESPALVSRVHRARLHAGEARLDASRALADLTDTCIRLASTIERSGLVREQGRQALARSRAAREQTARSRQPDRAPDAR